MNNVSDKHAPTTMNHKLEAMNKINLRGRKLKLKNRERCEEKTRKIFFYCDLKHDCQPLFGK